MILKVKNIFDKINEFAPYNLQSDYDNSGIMVGDRDMVTNGILVTLDTTLPVLIQAKEFGCNVVVEHHPIIWGGLKTIDPQLPNNDAICYAIKNDIAIISAHTNFDFAENGLNDFVAKKMELNSITKQNFDSPRIGVLNKITTLKEYAKKLSNIFGDKNVLTVGNLDKPIQKVAVINGGGGSDADIIMDTYRAGCDVYVSGEIKHNVGRLAKELNYAIIQINHQNCELDFIPLMEEKLKEKINTINVLSTTMLTNPFN
ncbi:MAG: Nif3-like dinuclear metal center hexameric protein [Clostridia bacterium]